MPLRYNKDEIAALATQSTNSYDKEGILIYREKSEGFFRRGEGSISKSDKKKTKRDSFICAGPSSSVCTERWFRLSGNLLFYLKSRDHLSEPLGVIVLENYSVKIDPKPSSPSSFNFVIDFEGGGYHVLGALSESERDNWMEWIKNASFSNLRARLTSLKLQLNSSHSSLKNNTNESMSSFYYDEIGTPIDEPLTIKACGYVQDMTESPVCEISVSCDNLLCDSHGRAPNPKLVVYVRNCPSQPWLKYGATEVVERSSNPSFLTTVSFRCSDGLDPNSTEVQFCIYNIRERVSGTRTLLGHLALPLASISSLERIRLPLLSTSNHSSNGGSTNGGFMTIGCWKLEREERGSTDSTPAKCTQNYGKGGNNTHNSMSYSHRRTQSLPPKLGSKLKFPCQSHFECLHSAPFIQTYRFHSGLGGDIFVHEIMAESKLSFLFPQQLLTLWIGEEKEVLQELIGVGELSEPWHSKQVALLQKHLSLINSYTQAKSNLLSYTGNDFKESANKGDGAYEFVPVNLHLQSMWAQNESLHKNGFHDVFTSGSFTATAQGFDSGGFFKLLRSSSLFEEKESGSKSSWYIANKVKITYDAVQGIKRLRKEIVERMQLIIKFAKERRTQGLNKFVDEIYHRCRLLLTICDESLFEEALEFLETHKVGSVPSSSSLNFDTYLTNGRSCSSSVATPDSGLGLDEFLSSFLSSPSSNYYRPTDEPEPWALTSLNIQASLISLHSKVAALSGEQSGALIFPRPVQRSSSMRSSEFSRGDEWRLSVRDEKNDKNVKISGKSSKSDKIVLSSPPPPHHQNESKLLNVYNNDSSCDKIDQNPEKSDNFTKCVVNESSRSEWGEELGGSLRKLRVAMDGLLKTARLSHSVFRLQESKEKAVGAFSIRYRRDVCFSQALTTVVSGLMSRFWCRKYDPSFVHILSQIGPLVTFSSFLTSYSAEAVMLADMNRAVQDLAHVSFILCMSRDEVGIPCPRVSGSRSNYKVYLPLPSSYLNILSSSPPVSFSIVPLLFNVGVNEMVALAGLKGGGEGEEIINRRNLDRMEAYYTEFKKLTLPLKYGGKRGSSVSDMSISKILEQLHTEITTKSSKKNTQIIHLSAAATRLMMGLRFMSCKSGKDRTSMGVTFEQAQILSQEYDLATHEFQLALDAMRSEGCRRENTLKNIGVRKYAFNSLQVYALPKSYQPPPGTYGATST